MKITAQWIPPGAIQPTNFTLADSPATIPLTNFKVNGTRLIQEAQFFRSLEREYYDRGNRATEITFDVSRVQSDQNTAEAFLLDHDNKMPPIGFTAIFTTGSGSGSSTTRYLVGATLQTTASWSRGLTTFHSYRITGGILTNTAN